MLNLDDNLYIGSGKHQSVYEDPEDSNLCVKVLIDTDPTFLKEEKRNRERESSYLTRVENKAPECESIVHFCGFVDTNKGDGAIYSLVRDEDGQISISLENYMEFLTTEIETKTIQVEEFGDALVNLYQNLLKYKIITRNIRPVNICVQKDLAGKIKNLVIIDALGPTEFIPITESISFLAISKIKRKYRRFVDLLRGYSSNATYQNTLDRVSDSIE